LWEFLGVKTNFSHWVAYKIKQYGFIENKEFWRILAKTNGPGQRTVNGRDLWEFLEVKSIFAGWIRYKFKQYGFIEKTDYLLFLAKNRGRGRPTQEHHLRLDRAIRTAGRSLPFVLFLRGGPGRCSCEHPPLCECKHGDPSSGFWVFGCVKCTTSGCGSLSPACRRYLARIAAGGTFRQIRLNAAPIDSPPVNQTPLSLEGPLLAQLHGRDALRGPNPGDLAGGHA
jgi:phage anti-repressor protein